MATIKDIAKISSVSTSTVSHVLNHTRYVSPELRDRVIAAVKELNYTPNHLARSLREGRTNTLGLIVPDNSNPFFAEVAKGAEDQGFEHGYRVILCNSDNDELKERAYLSALASNRVDGIIIVSASLSAINISSLIKAGLVLVLLDREIPGVGADLVLTDNYGGAYAATEHLISLGHRRIACIAGPSDLMPCMDRLRGYKDALDTAGFTVSRDLIYQGDFRIKGGIEAAQYLLGLEQRPTAIFCCNDFMAIGALGEFWDRQVQVPDDIALIGFDDISIARLVRPSLSTVEQPKIEMGRVAVDLLLARILGHDIGEKHRIILKNRLVLRESSGGVCTRC